MVMVYGITQEIFNANIYLAKGIGIIGVKLNNFEEISDYRYIQYNYHYYLRRTAVGEMGVID